MRYVLDYCFLCIMYSVLGLCSLQDADECRRLLKEEFGKHDGEGTRVHRTLHDFAENKYLAQLSFVQRNSKTLSFV